MHVSDIGPVSDGLRAFINEAPQIRAPHVPFLRRAAEELGKGAKVLDVGAGMAPYRELFADLDYTTVDWAESLHNPDTASDIIAPAHAIPLPDASVDGIVFTQVLEHIPEPGPVLDEFVRLLKPDGTLWLTVPLTWYLHEVPYDFYRYTPWGLRHVLEQAGFEDIDVQPMNDSMGSIAELLRHLRWNIGNAGDDLDERRAVAGAMLADMAATVESVGYLDTQRLLPLSLSARAVRPRRAFDAHVTDAPALTETHTADPSNELVPSTDHEGEAPDVTVVVTAHREGTLAHHTMRSLVRALDDARSHGLSSEVLCVLDRADEPTRRFFVDAVGPSGYFGGVCPARMMEVDHGDPGASRNAAIQSARGKWVAIVDADNLVSQNWIREAVQALRTTTSPAVVHPEYLITFGQHHIVWPQIPSTSNEFRPDAFYSFNYWDTICVAERALFRDYPYTPTASGFGPEDWHWNTVTLANGVEHHVATGTSLFYRVKAEGSRNHELLSEGRPLQQTPLLTSKSIADNSAIDIPEPVESLQPAHVTPQLRHVLDVAHGLTEESAPALTSDSGHVPQPTGLRGIFRRARGESSPVVPAQYRLLHEDLTHLSDAELVNHFERYGRREGRSPRFTEEHEALLSPDTFIPAHYRLLNPDLADFDDMALARHFLVYGAPEQRRTRLTPKELEALDHFDLDDYRSLNPDLRTLTDDVLVAHFVRDGMAERRRARLTWQERTRLLHELPAPVVEEWCAVHELDPAIPIPSTGMVASYDWYLPPAPDDARNAAWWRLVEKMPERADFIFFAPWVRMGGGDAVLARYARLVSERHPDEQVVVVTTEGDSTRTEWLPENVHLVELLDIAEYTELTRPEQIRLVASLVVQYAPRATHVMNSPVGFDAVERFSGPMAARTKIFLSTFVIERAPAGDMFNWMFKRHPRFLDDVSSVIVDNGVLVDQLWELYRFPRGKFVVHHQPAELPAAGIEPRIAADKTGIDVLWAARFDRQKRPDILAAIVAECMRRNLDIRFHVYGASVMGGADEFAADLDSLRSVGVSFYAPYASFADLPPERFDAFLLTSQWEGIPLILLDAMAYGVPTVASAVGGIPEVLDNTTGYPVERFDDIDAYVDALVAVLKDPVTAREKARNARQRLADEFSWSAFEKTVVNTPGYL